MQNNYDDAKKEKSSESSFMPKDRALLAKSEKQS